MTEPLVPPPLPDAAPPPLPPAPNRTATIAAWAVILLSVAYIVTANVREKSTPAGQAARAGAATELQFRISSRYAVGAHHLAALAAGGKDANATKLMDPVDAAAKTPEAKLRAAAVAGEVLGADAATQRLDKLIGSDAVDEPLRQDAAALRRVYAAGDAREVPGGQREALVARHGWYGKLSLAYGLPADCPPRREALRPALRAMIALLSGVLLLLGALAVGLALLVVAIVRRASGKLVTAYRPPTAPTGPFLEAVAAFLAAMVALSALVRLLMGISMAAAWFPLVLLPAVMLYPLLRGVDRAGLRRGLGWHTGRGVFREIAAGVVGYVAGLPLLAAGAVVTMVLTRVFSSDTAHPIVNEFGRSAGKTLRLLFLAAVWAPLVEETVFRGAFYHHLRRRTAWPVAALVVGVFFAAIHPQGWAAVPTLTAIAFVLAALREWRGSIIPSVVGHAMNNGFVTLLLVLVLS